MKCFKLFLFISSLILLSYAAKAGEMKFLWSVPTPDKNVHTLCFINNDEEFIAGSNVDLAVHNSETGELLRRLPEIDASKFELMKGGQTALVLSGARLVKVDLNEMNITQETKLPTEKDGWEIRYKNLTIDTIRNNVYLSLDYEFNDAGNYSFYHEIRVYDLESLSEKYELTTEEQRKYPLYFSISTDCKYFAAVNDGKSYLRVWETETNKLVVDYPLMPESSNEWGNPADLEFSPSDSDLLYVSGAFRHNSNDEDHMGFFIFDINKKTIIDNTFNVSGLQHSGIINFFNNINYLLLTRNDFCFIYDLNKKNIIYNEAHHYTYGWPSPIISKEDVIIGASHQLSSGKYYFDSSIVEDLEETVLYPNPTTNQVFLPCKYFIPRENIKVFDEGGREVTSLVQINTNEEGITLNLDNLVKGMYILQVVYANEAVSYKIIKGE